MWIFDGEEWTEEGEATTVPRKDSPTPRFDEFVPELQVVEIVPVPTHRIPPMPFP